MPAESQAQRAELNWKFGHAWVKRHNFDNKGKLPAHVRHGVNDSRMMEGSFSIPLDGKNRKLTFNEMEQRGRNEIGAVNESNYLVRVKGKDGKPEYHLPVHDARHMGDAWAALHEGFRGHKYEGPGKEEAITKLKALYKKRGMEVPS